MTITVIYSDQKHLRVKIEPLKEYDEFTLYQAYRVTQSGKLMPLYKVCFSVRHIDKLQRMACKVEAPPRGGNWWVNIVA